jgi:L-alanine-DL-glutamate epimerase-like enolase superfamily enzyme
MKITAIHTHYVRIPFDMGAPKQEFAGLRFPTMDHLLVQVETDAGITGWGEGFGHSIIPATKAALETYVGPWFIGKDATDINALHAGRPGHPHLRPQRPRGLRALRHRHRAVGHRR